MGSAGNFRVGQANTGYTGNVILNSGGIFEFGATNAVASGATITVGNEGEFGVVTGVTSSNNITVSGGTNSVLSFINGGAGVMSGSITLNANATIGLRNWYNYATVQSGTISGVMSGTGGITVNSGSGTGGTLTLTQNEGYTGGTTISGAILQLGNGGTTGALSTSSAIALNANGFLQINRSNAVVQGTDFNPAALTGAGGFTQAGTGTTTLNAANTFAGATTLTAGTLSVADTSYLGGATGNNSLVFNGGTLQVTGTTMTSFGSHAVTYNASKTVGFDINHAANNFNAGTTAFVATDTLLKTGAGTLTLGAASNTLKTVQLNQGTLDIGSNNLTISNAGGATINNVTTNSVTINATGGGKIVLTQNHATDGPDIGAANGGTLTINASITGTSAYENWTGTNNGTGVTVLTGANDYTGNTIINGGVLSVSSIGNTGSTTSNLGQASTINISSVAGNENSTLRYTGSGETTNRVVNFHLNGTGTGGIIEQSGTGLLKFTSNQTSTGTGTKTLTLQGSTAGTGEFAGNIVNGSSTVALAKAGTGTWTISGANTYTGATTISGGTLKNGSATTFSGSNTALSMSGTGTFDLNGFNASVNGITTASGNTITNNGGTDVTLTSAGGGTAAGLFTDGMTNKLAISLTNANNTPQFTNTANTFSGGLNLLNNATGTRLFINSAISFAGTPGALTSGNFGTGTITIGTTSTDKAGIRFDSLASGSVGNAIVFNTALGTDVTGITSTTTTGVTLAGAITANSNAAFNTNATNAKLTVSGAISGNGGVVVTQSAGTGGIVTLSGSNNSYAGTTTISSGTLSTNTLANGLSNSGIGASSNVAANLILNGGTLQYTGGAVSTDRLFSLQSNSTIDASGTGAVNFANTGSIGFNSGTAAKTLTLTGTNTGTNTLAAAIGDNTGTTSIYKSGAGSWSITNAASTFTGSIQAQGGVLNWSGSNTSVTASNGGGWLAVGTSGNGRLNITGGSLTRYDVGIGGASTVGAVYQSGGSFAVQRTAGTGDFRIGDATGAYGYYKLSGSASLSTNEIGIGSANGTTGVMEIAGGTFTSNGWITVGRGGTTSSGLLNVTGGTVEFSKTAGAADAGNSKLALQWGGSSGAQSIVNIANGSVTGDDYIDLATTNTTGTLGAINLLSGGILQGSRVTVSTANPTALLNFNGGTLRANPTTNGGVNFMNSVNMDAVTVYSGGGTIDNNATSITIGNALAAAAGNGITSIGVTTKGAGYLGAPMVTISGGTGNTATGYAVMEDDGTGNGTFRVASIVITSPGTYTVDPTTVILTGGGATTAASGFAISTAANISGGMTFQGSGTTTLTGPNTYTGGTTLNQGTLTVGTNGTLGATTGALSVNNTNSTSAATNAVLNLATAVDTTAGSLSGTIATPTSGTNTATINNGGSGRNFTVNQTTGGTYAGVIAGAGAFTLGSSSTNTLTLSGANSYSGGTSINGGILKFAKTNAMPSAGAVSVASGATLAVNAGGAGEFAAGSGNGTVGGLFAGLGGQSGSTISYTSGARIGVDTTSATSPVTESSNLAGSGIGLTKLGSGTLNLTGTNTYTGATNVNAGTLAINGDQSAATGAVTVAAGSTNATAVRLGGSGIIGGATSFAADPDAAGAQVGGIHSVGNSVGKQTFNSTLTYNTGSIFEWELASTPAETGRGFSYDAVNVTGGQGSLEATTGAIFRVVLQGTQNFGEEFWNQTRNWSDIFKSADGGANLDIASIFSGGFQYYNYSGPGGTLASVAPSTGSFSFTSGNTLTWSAVPEPSSAFAGLLIGAGLLRRRRQN